MTGAAGPAGPQVRRADPADLEAVAALESECFPLDPWPAAYLRQAVAGAMPTVRILVLEESGAVAAYAIVSVVFEVAELQRIGVAPAYRRRGHAGAVVDGCVEVARAEGAERLLLEVREDNVPALALYRAAGFTEIDRRERYYRDGATALVLARDLPSGRPGRPG